MLHTKGPCQTSYGKKVTCVPGETAWLFTRGPVTGHPMWAVICATLLYCRWSWQTSIFTQAAVHILCCVVQTHHTVCSPDLTARQWPSPPHSTGILKLVRGTDTHLKATSPTRLWTFGPICYHPAKLQIFWTTCAQTIQLNAVTCQVPITGEETKLFQVIALLE
jgi:hypothetical protein